MQSAHPSEFGDHGPITEQLISPLERDALPAGTLLGGCQIVEAVSCDGRSIVYLASDGALQREVLIKEHFPSHLVSRQGVAVSLLSGADADERADALDVFLREARLLARLDHPAIVRLHRFWEEHRTAYMMMPFQPSQSLAITLQRLDGPATERWLRALMDPVLDALKVLHDRDCYHLGLSPDTISLLPDGQPLLRDLSSASQVAGERLPADADSVDRLYVPIEQFSHGAELGIGPWSDLYALAAVAHHAMLGRPPVSAAVLGPDDRLEPLAESLRARPDASYSASFVAAIDQALAVRPQDRPQNVPAFQRLLALFEDSASVVPVSSLPPVVSESPSAEPSSATPAASKDVPAARPDHTATAVPLSATPTEPAVSPLAHGPADDPQTIDPAVTAAIALAISSLPWDTKHEPTLAPPPAPAPSASAPTPASTGEPVESMIPAELLSEMAPGSRTHPEVGPARRQIGRWAAATASLLVVAVGGWYALTQGEARVPTARLANPMAASAPQGPGAATVAPVTAPAPAALPAANATATLALPDEPTSASPAAALPASAANNTGPAATLAGNTATANAIPAPPFASAPAPAAQVAAPASAVQAAPAAGRATASAKAKRAERNRLRAQAEAIAADTEPASPRAACGTRTNFSLEYCMQIQCRQARFSRHPQCRAMR